MPQSMFEDVVCPRAGTTRKWYMVPLSFVVHTAAIVLVVVAPLVATDVLPSPRSILEYAAPSAMPVVPLPPPAAARATSVRAELSANPNTAPVEAPSGVKPEPSLVDEPAAVTGVEGAIVGLGRDVVIDAPPPLPYVGPEAVKTVRAGGVITPPVRIKDAAPVYPAIAIAGRVQGDVIIEATIGIDGKVEKARVLRSVTLLDKAALDAVYAWQYAPTRLNGEPVAVLMTVTVRFRLQ